MDDIDVDWIKDHPDINKVARRCQPAFRLSDFFDQSWDPEHVHFLITAKETVDGYSPESPLQAMHRSESHVSTSP